MLRTSTESNFSRTRNWRRNSSQTSMISTRLSIWKQNMCNRYFVSPAKLPSICWHARWMQQLQKGTDIEKNIEQRFGWPINDGAIQSNSYSLQPPIVLWGHWIDQKSHHRVYKQQHFHCFPFFYFFPPNLFWPEFPSNCHPFILVSTRTRTCPLCWLLGEFFLSHISVYPLPNRLEMILLPMYIFQHLSDTGPRVKWFEFLKKKIFSMILHLIAVCDSCTKHWTAYCNRLFIYPVAL